ncbi:MAG: prolyl oligopeptidase family serine peptidase [Trueperaceae bacterium]|nr:prolyl oligopeptidase family serine peptidase [Trueperaceae bacterium]MCW5819347.1 S9 family peptidase [Trueperaceae bacterium]
MTSHDAIPAAAIPEEGRSYRLPPAAVAQLVTAPQPRAGFASPDGRLVLTAELEDLFDLAYLAQPTVSVAGMRIFAHDNSQVKTRFYRRPQVVDVLTGKTVTLRLDERARLGLPIWAHDGSKVAFPRYAASGVELWVADTGTGEVRDLTGPVVNATLSPGYRQTEHVLNASWTPDSKGVLVHVIPEGRGPAPQRATVPTGPIEMVTVGRFSREHRWEDLNTSPYDEQLFEHYCSSQLVEIDVLSGERRPLGPPGLYCEPPAVSPDGRYVLVHRVTRPYSYWVPYRGFGTSIEVWHRDGSLAHVVADRLPTDTAPDSLKNAPRPRLVQWQAHEDATLVWAEAAEKGAAMTAEGTQYRDRVLSLTAPFDGPPTVLMRLGQTAQEIRWLADPRFALVYEFDSENEWIDVLLVDLPRGAPSKVFSYSQVDRYGHPGTPVTTLTSRGELVVRQDEGWLYLTGPGGSDEGDRPFLDRFNPDTLERERLFQSSPDHHDQPIGMPSPHAHELVISRESPDEPPDYYVVGGAGPLPRRLTQSPAPAPRLRTISRQMVRYLRGDGVRLSGILYLPEGFQPGARLPLVIWAYPTDYVQAEIASQVRIAPRSFNFFPSLPRRAAAPQLFATQGYAVLDMAEMPVVGNSRTRNDTYLEQLVASAAAAIGHLDERGIVDPGRVGMIGHSYGGFSTANLLAHCDLFAAGIAHSCAYNRTLSPWGFQRERRSLWEAPDTYVGVSPLFHADKITAPLLMVHGQSDDSQTSKPTQSLAMFHALRGLGKTSKLILLPYENHYLHAYESVLHVAAEELEWFDRYVKGRE